MKKRRRKTKWELIVVALTALFFAASITAAAYAQKENHVEQSHPPERRITTPQPIDNNSLVSSMDWDTQDSDILLRIAMGEAEGESTEGKALVMLVVLNRVWSDGFPDTIKDVVFQTTGGNYQFSPVEPGGRYWTTEPNDDCRAALQLIENGWDESDGALYFDACAGDSWQGRNCQYLFTCGGHSFYK